MECSSWHCFEPVLEAIWPTYDEVDARWVRAEVKEIEEDDF